MKIIQQLRGWGKTESLLSKANQTWAYILFANRMALAYVIDVAKERWYDYEKYFP